MHPIRAAHIVMKTSCNSMHAHSPTCNSTADCSCLSARLRRRRQLAAAPRFRIIIIHRARGEKAVCLKFDCVCACRELVAACICWGCKAAMHSIAFTKNDSASHLDRFRLREVSATSGSSSYFRLLVCIWQAQTTRQC